MQTFTVLGTLPFIALFPAFCLASDKGDIKAVMIIDVSNSKRTPCEDAGAIARGILGQPYGRHSSLLVITTGDAASANEPRIIGSYALPSTGRVLEGHGRVKEERKQLPAQIMKDCAGVTGTRVSPIFLAMKAGLTQLHNMGCGTESRCILYATTDGEENTETNVRRALDGKQGATSLAGVLDNIGIDVKICGISETIGNKTEKGGKQYTMTTARNGQRVDRLEHLWHEVFKQPDRVRLSNFCTESGVL